MTTLNTQAALKILIQAVEVGNKAGAYSLQESGVISQAVQFFTVQKEESKEPTKEPVDAKKTK